MIEQYTFYINWKYTSKRNFRGTNSPRTGTVYIFSLLATEILKSISLSKKKNKFSSFILFISQKKIQSLHTFPQIYLYHPLSFRFFFQFFTYYSFYILISPELNLSPIVGMHTMKNNMLDVFKFLFLLFFFYIYCMKVGEEFGMVKMTVNA